MQQKTRLVGAVLAALAVLGLGGAAVAQPTTRPDHAAVQPGPSDADTNRGEGSEVEDVTEEPSYTSSVTTAGGSGSEDDEGAALAGLATVKEDAAKAAALAAVPGTVVQVELDNENGSVVYSVEVDNGNGIVDVKVDAGSGKVLHSDGPETEGPETGAEADD